MNTNKIFIKGTFLGLILGLAFTLGFVVSAAWVDPTSAPPTGGFLKVNTTGAPAAGDCNIAAEGGRLWYNDITHELFLCDGNTIGWEQISP